MKQLRVVAVHLGRAPQVENIPNSLESFQKFVGGTIAMYHLHRLRRGLVLVVNDDGMALELKPNAQGARFWPFVIMPPQGTLLGDFFICRVEGGEEVDITDEDVKVLLGARP